MDWRAGVEIIKAQPLGVYEYITGRSISAVLMSIVFSLAMKLISERQHEQATHSG
jgi:hypothetical protein